MFMKFKFENLIIWQKAICFAYNLMNMMVAFKKKIE